MSTKKKAAAPAEPEDELSQEVPQEKAAPEAENEAPNPLEGAVAELKDSLLRKVAEFDNFKKRSAREKDEIYTVAVSDAVNAILPILDNFQSALTSPCNDEEYKKGFVMIEKQFEDALAGLGVTEIASEGSPFDPAFHNAVMHVEDEAVKENTIVEVFQKGYRLGDKVIRHAMVKVAN